MPVLVVIFKRKKKRVEMNEDYATIQVDTEPSTPSRSHPTTRIDISLPPNRAVVCHPLTADDRPTEIDRCKAKTNTYNLLSAMPTAASEKTDCQGSTLMSSKRNMGVRMS